jgi:chromosome segregation ATPase
LQAQLQDQKKQEEREQTLQQQLAESKAQAEDLSSKLERMGQQVRRLEEQVSIQSSDIECELRCVAHLQSQLHAHEKSLGEARASLSSLHTENARLDAELKLSHDALNASHARERELIVQLETSRNNVIAETSSRVLVASEQHRISQCQVEALHKELLEVQVQLREARRSADAALAAEHETALRLSGANSEIVRLKCLSHCDYL